MRVNIMAPVKVILAAVKDSCWYYAIFRRFFNKILLRQNLVVLLAPSKMHVTANPIA